MECPVCYENSVNCTLVCGHKFCKSCVKTWYLKGSDGGCPMCRRKVHYRRMPTRKWREEAFENKLNEVYQESFDELIDDLLEPMQFKIGENIDENWKSEISPDRYIPVVNGNTLTIYRKNVRLDEVADLEKTYRAIKDVVVDTDELDYILNETYDYYSDRRVHLNKRVYGEAGHWYPHQKHRGGTHAGSRTHAGMRTHAGSRTHAGMRNNFQRR